ncbi:hypothetical protein, partial [Stenotrophomonas maltophilia]
HSNRWTIATAAALKANNSCARLQPESSTATFGQHIVGCDDVYAADMPKLFLPMLMQALARR